jgi:hypothetical protein
VISKCVFFLTLAFLCLGQSAYADIRALLVGVSDYDEGTGVSDLRGPVNDVLLMKDVLEKRGATDVLVVADGIDGAKRPTLSSIEAGFAEITARSSSGDLVYIHLSGHGTRQHDQNGDETDGLDEVFLPANVAVAAKGAAVIPNALSDDRIGELILAIRETGADVWLVMDSCYSGSGMRSYSETTAERQVDPSVLGIDLQSAKPVAQAIVSEARPASEDMGGYLAFYATRSNDVAREGDLSKGEGNAQWFGLFSSALGARLDSSQALSYRQLFQAVLSDMNRGSGFGATGVQTPLWEGDLIDAPVFGGSVATGISRYLIEGDQINAGLIHGLQVGTLLGLVADITDAPENLQGYAQIEEVLARKAYMRPVTSGCQPKSNALCEYSGSLSPEARFAQVELHPTDRVVRFSPLVNFESGALVSSDNAVQIAFSTALEEAAKRSGIPAEITTEGFDVHTVLRGGSLWFGPVTSIGDEPAGLEVPWQNAEIPKALLQPILRILKAEQVAQTLELLDGGVSFANPSPVKIHAERYQSALSQLTKPGERVNARRECGPVYQAAKVGEFDEMDIASDVKQCDILRFSALGDKAGQRDVNRIHIDAQYCVNVDYELVEGARTARSLGNEMIVCSDCPGQKSSSAGHERLYFLVSELEENAEALNLTGLVENCISGGNGNRSAKGAVVREMLSQVGLSGLTRGNMGPSVGSVQSSVWVQSFRWRVLPRIVAFKQAETQ